MDDGDGQRMDVMAIRKQRAQAAGVVGMRVRDENDETLCIAQNVPFEQLSENERAAVEQIERAILLKTGGGVAKRRAKRGANA